MGSFHWGVFIIVDIEKLKLEMLTSPNNRDVAYNSDVAFCPADDRLIASTAVLSGLKEGIAGTRRIRFWIVGEDTERVPIQLAMKSQNGDDEPINNNTTPHPGTESTNEASTTKPPLRNCIFRAHDSQGNLLENFTIKIDGEKIQTTNNPVETTLSPGTHEVVILKDGYQPKRETIYIRVGQLTKELSFKLLPIQQESAVNDNHPQLEKKIIVDIKWPLPYIDTDKVFPIRIQARSHLDKNLNLKYDIREMNSELAFIVIHPTRPIHRRG